MMHCTMDDLLALQAGEASGWARKHLETCAVCRAELDILYQRVAQLKALPGLRAPRDRWPAVRAVVLAGRDRRRRVWRVGTLAALGDGSRRAAGTGAAALGDARIDPAAGGRRR